MSRRNAVLAFVLLLGGAPAAAQGPDDITVFSASGPSARTFPQGRRLARDERLVLRPGDEVTLVRGEFARIFSGPGTFLAGDFASPTRRRSRGVSTGAVRDPSPAPPPAGPNAPQASGGGGPLSRFIICPGHTRCPQN